MVIPADLSAPILRLYLAERWRVDTIARLLHLHRSVMLEFEGKNYRLKEAAARLAIAAEA